MITIHVIEYDVFNLVFDKSILYISFSHESSSIMYPSTSIRMYIENVNRRNKKFINFDQQFLPHFFPFLYRITVRMWSGSSMMKTQISFRWFRTAHLDSMPIDFRYEL